MKIIISDFARNVESFFTEFLAAETNASKHTIRAYRDTFVLLIDFMKQQYNIPVDKLQLGNLNREVICSFLKWLETERNNSISTQAQRLAAICSFCDYLSRKNPERLATWQSIRSIRIRKKQSKTMNYLTVDGLKLLLDQVPTDSIHGRRNLTLLSLLYETGARVQELIDLTPSNIRFEKPSIIRLHGKGDKIRIVPLREEIVKLLTVYMAEHRLDLPSRCNSPLFFNSRYEKLTNSGIAYIINTYSDMARKKDSSGIPNKISPHCFRHSRAMHLLQAGVNLVYIRDLLGHSSIQTTEIYARADSLQKRIALEKATESVMGIEVKEASWEIDKGLKAFLKGLA